MENVSAENKIDQSVRELSGDITAYVEGQRGCSPSLLRNKPHMDALWLHSVRVPTMCSQAQKSHGIGIGAISRGVAMGLLVDPLL